MTAPASGVKYRIQSVDFLTYIEALAGTGVGLRPAKNSAYQYWQFETVTVSGSTGFYIRNVGNSTRCLHCDGTSITASPPSSGPTYWLAKVLHESGSYRITVLRISTDYYVYPDESGTSVKATRTTNDTDNQRWQFIPVTSSVPIYDALHTGNYRIRNLNGKSLLTLPVKESVGTTNLYVRSQRDANDKLRAHQRWIVTQQESGKYTIQNAGDSAYLGWSVATPTVGDSLVGSQNVYLWNIQSIGGFAWSLRIPKAGLSVGVADNDIEDEDEMSLVSSDNTSSQIWFMEKYIPLGKDVIHAKREVEEGTYALQSANDLSVYMKATSNPWLITSVTNPTTFSKFKLKYVDKKSAHFTLTYSTAAASAVVADAGGYIGLKDSGTEFVLLEKDKGDPGYVLCRPDPGHPHKVVSTRTKKDGNGNFVFFIENKVTGDKTQMWNFVLMA